MPEPQYPLYSEDGNFSNFQYLPPTPPPPPLSPCTEPFGCEGAGPNFGLNTNAPRPKDTCDAMPMPMGFVTDLPMFMNRYINGAAYPAVSARQARDAASHGPRCRMPRRLEALRSVRVRSAP